MRGCGSPATQAPAFRPRPASAASTRRLRCRSSTRVNAPEGPSSAATRRARPPTRGRSPTASATRSSRRRSRLIDHGVFHGALIAEYSVERLLRYFVPTEISRRHAISVLDARDRSLASTVMTLPGSKTARPSIVFELPVAPAENGLVLRGQGYRTSIGLIGNGLFWMVMLLSALTVWMLLGTWRHMRRRLQMQAALVSETNFRRAMENSMLTGMRAMDLEGRISYVNPAFCAMTGFAEADLIGQHPPFPYWPHDRRDENARLLEQELQGKQPDRRHRGQGDEEGRLDLRCPHVRLAADRPEGRADRLDDLDDQHHRGQADPRPAHRLARAFHDGAGGPRHRRLGALGAKRRAAVRQPFVPALVRRRFERPRAAFGRRIFACRCRSTATSTTPSTALGGLPTQELTAAGSDSREVYVEALGKWFDVRARYLQWTDGRLAQMLIATDITERRNAEAVAARPGREGASHQPARDDGRDGVVGRARTQSAAHRDHQLLQRHGHAGRERRDRQGRPDRRAAEDLAPGRARRPDHPPHPLVRETKRAAAPEEPRRRPSSTTPSTSPASSCAAATSRSRPTSRSACRR